MSDTFSLATRLRAMDDARLAAAARAREIRVSGIKDFFDLAEALLDRASVQQQLTHLDRGTLATIAAIAELGSHSGGSTAADVAALLDSYAEAPPESDIAVRATTAVSLLLADSETDGEGVERFTAYDHVAEQVRSWPAFGLPSLPELATGLPLAAIEPAPETELRFIDRVASERAFAATTGITELLVELEREPARELAKGGIALPDTKRLANAMAVDLAGVGRLLAIADDAGLVAREAGSWLITDAGGAWLMESSGARWRTLAAGWFERLPGDIRRLLGERTH
ncbi:MAG TPA: hypothetical protein VLS46_04160, partial [Gaiellaceae bacterium]|nr:hypothetical protein [Gaiellaceae bacterium]